MRMVTWNVCAVVVRPRRFVANFAVLMRAATLLMRHLPRLIGHCAQKGLDFGVFSP